MITISQGKLFKMPAGEWHISVTDPEDSLMKPFGRLTPKRGPLTGQQIAYVQGGSPDDMVALAIWADAVHRDGGVPSLIIPYLPGARQDRRREGEALSSAVYANFINACKFDKVVCVDPHSDVMPALIDRCVVVDIDELWMHTVHMSDFREYAGFIVPDGGAGKRVGKVSLLCQVPTFQATKHRDMATGMLSGFGCEELPSEGRLLVVDDICDGGGTFKGLASLLKEEQGVETERLDLWVTHGVFSGNGAAELADFFDRIYCTDSFEPFAATAHYDHRFTNKVRKVELHRILREYV